MIQIGKINTRRVVRRSDFGIFLEGDDHWDNILLPNKYVTNDIQVDDKIEVFIYFDSEGRIISTTQKPLAQVGDFATLKVTSIEEFGIFLDWGIDKDLFLPFREQLFKMEVGQSYPVRVYLDNSGRPAASTRINKFVDKGQPPYKVGDAVELLLYQRTNMGLRALVDGQYTGVIYRDDLINNLRLGQTLTGYIKNVRTDKKIDLILKSLDTKRPKDLSEMIVSELKKNGGYLDINAKTTADIINERFGVSRKKFKVALGALYKQQRIEIQDNGISLALQ